MKQLHEYETPITNELYRTVDRDDLRSTFEEIRDLERKLRMCRDAIDSVLEYIDACTITESPDWQPLLDAREALDQTK